MSERNNLELYPGPPMAGNVFDSSRPSQRVSGARSRTASAMASLPTGDTASAHLASTAAGWENGGGGGGDDHPADHSDHSDLPYPPAMVDNSKGPSRRVSGELPRRIGLDDGVNVEVPENRRDHYQVTSAAVSLLPPISLTMLLVVILIKLIPSLHREDNSEGAGFLGVNVEASSDDTASAQFSGATLQALILIGFVIVMTTVLVLCVKFECYRALGTYLGLMLFLLLGYFSYQLIVLFCQAVNVAADLPALVFICWNYLVVGLLALGAGKMPLRVMQFYHVTLSAIMACQFLSFLGTWATWAVLFLMAVWDLIAVLCPFGPLRVLIELTEEKGIKVPDALIYSTSLEETGGGGGADRSPVAHLPGLGLTANGGGDGDSARSAEEGSGGGNNRTTQPPATSIPGLGIGDGSSAPRTAGSPASGGHDGSAAASAQRRRQSQTVAQHQASIDAERRAEAEEEAAEHSGPKLGLGDFIFYSVLMALTAQKDDWGAVLACYLSIILGLTATLWILILHGKALPALPIPLFIAMVMYFSVDLSVSPMMERLQFDCIYI